MSDNDYRERDDANDDIEERGERHGRGRRQSQMSDDREDRGGRGGMRGRRGRRRKEDYFDANSTVPDYKDVETLKRFLTDRAKIRPRRQTGLSSKNQRKLALQIKRARHLALLPFTDDQLRR